MALSANTVLEVRSTGADTNGGGYVTGSSGTDWSQQDAAQYSVTDGVTAGTTTITSATANFGTDVVGNLIYVQGGTGSVTAGWYQITSRTNATTIVVDRSTGLTAGTGVTLKIGGAFATPGAAGAIATIAGMQVAHKYNATAVTLSNTTANTAGGPFSFSAARVLYYGYDTTRSPDNTDTNQPTIKAGANSTTFFAGGRQGAWVINIIVDANAKTSCTGFSFGSAGAPLSALRCTAVGCATGFSGGNGNARFIRCRATSGTTGFITSSGARFYYCIADLNSGNGIAPQDSTSVVIGSIAYRNGGFGIGNGLGTGAMNSAINCVSYGNTGAGFQATNLTGNYLPPATINCIAARSGGYGYDIDTATNPWSGYVQSCAGYLNSSGNARGTSATGVVGLIALTGDPFDQTTINALTQSSTWADILSAFTPNNTAGAGAAVRAAGFIPYQDVGAVQHQDAGGGGTAYVPIRGHRRLVVVPGVPRPARRLPIPGPTTTATAYVPIPGVRRQVVRSPAAQKSRVLPIPGLPVPIVVRSKRVEARATTPRRLTAVVAVTRPVAIAPRARTVIRPVHYRRPAVSPIVSVITNVTQTVLVTSRRTLR